MSFYQFPNRMDVHGAGNESIFNYMPNRINRETGSLELNIPMANYAGPKTDVKRRWIDEKRYGTTKTDDSARLHDIQYNNLGILKAQNRINDQQLIKGIKNSDAQLLSAAKSNLLSIRPFNAAHAVATYTGIKSKNLLQDINIVPWSAFTTSNKNRPLLSETSPETVVQLPIGYMGTGAIKKPKKIDRLKKLRKHLK